jgi:regulator of nucleoside diphosphate kinase
MNEKDADVTAAPRPCRLTEKDHAILERLLAQCHEPHGAFAALLRGKLAGARLWLAADIPPDVVTINSRVIFRADDGPLQTRIVAQSSSTGLVGLLLPVTSLRGLALLGMTAGESIHIEEGEGAITRLAVEAVAYQPEAARREALAVGADRPRLRLVHSAPGLPREERVRPIRPMNDGDDPGPSAA